MTTVLVLLNVVYFVFLFVLLLLIGKTFGVGWEIAAIPVGMVGGFAGGALVAESAMRRNR